MKRTSILSWNTLPAFAGGVFLCVSVFNGLLRRIGQQSVANALLFIISLLFTSNALAALLITQPPAELRVDASTAVARSNVQVLRYEHIGFYRYDPDSPESFILNRANFSTRDSLTGTPNSRGALPAPRDSRGDTLSFGSSIGLRSVTQYDDDEALLGFTEPLFIVAKGPILPASGFATRNNGRRYIAVTVDIENGNSYIVTLEETSPGSGDFVGYLQPNLADGLIVIPTDSQVTLRYNNNGDVPDDETTQAPWFVDPAIVERFDAERRIVSAPFVETENQLFLTKQALRTTAMAGDFLAYDLTLENVGETAVQDIRISDRMPVGFRYQSGSARVNGETRINPEIDNTGRVLEFTVGELTAGQSITIRYVVEVTITTPTGKAVNTAYAYTPSTRSPDASAVVIVEQALFNDRAFLVGRVIAGECGDASGEGVEGVRIYMEDGTNVVTDKHGRWHIEGVRPGTHVLQLDTITLGPRYSLRQCNDNTRQAGNPRSRFVNVQGGTLWRENWYLDVKPGLDANLQQQLTTNIVDGQAVISISLRNGETRFDKILSHIFLPDDLTPLPGSATLNGKPISDPQLINNFYEFRTQPAGYYSNDVLSLALAVNPDARDSAERSIMVNSYGTTSQGVVHSVSSMNRLALDGVLMSDDAIVLRPRFASMSADLSDDDKARIRESVEGMQHYENIRLTVTGHSDNQPIRPRAGRLINDNYALSLARASAVAEYLGDLLGIESQHIKVDGVGPDSPVADNSTPEGRALNRRVTLEFFVSERVGDAAIRVVQGDSGINRDRATERNGNGEDDEPGFVNVHDGMVISNSVLSVTALLDSRLKPQLLLNGEPVPDGRIGMRMKEEKSGMTRYTWVGLELDRTGDHLLELNGIGSFNIKRFTESATVRRSARVKTIRAATPVENTADGRTPLQVRLQVLDEYDRPIEAGLQLRLLSGPLTPLNASQSLDPLTQRPDTVLVDSQGIARFEPVGTAGTYRIRLSDGQVESEEIEVQVAPDLREWILVGFAEGSMGYNTLRNNMENLGDPDNHFYTNGDTSFFARGQIKGEWLLTMAYDSRSREQDQPFMQAIDPQRWYSLYGDDTLRGHDAASREKLYLRIEKRDFHALFGDYDTGLTTTELSRYQRSLTGGQIQWRGRNATAMAFAAETTQGFVRDDIAPDGTSGLYRLSRNAIVPASESIVLEVRDRFTNEVVSTVNMTRFIDYSIDYMDGSFYFRRPIMVQDENFNPQRIVVTYEVDGGEDNTVAGTRVTLNNNSETVVVGLTGVDDNTAGADGTLAGADITWTPNASHTVKLEGANTNQDTTLGSSRDSAWMAEHRFTSESVDTRLRVDQTDGGFGLGQIAPDADDIRTSQASVRYRINEELALTSDLNRQQILSTNNQRDVAEGRVEYQREDWQLYSGLRQSEDRIDDEDFMSRQAIAGARKGFMDRRLTLSASGETSIGSSDENRDYPSRLMLGSDYRLTKKVSVFANQDFTWGQERRTQDTRVGARANPWQGGTVSSEVSRGMDEYGPRMMAHAGLLQTIELTPQWTGDFGFDRAQTITGGTVTDEPDLFDPRRGPTAGTANNDYTAVSTGLGYRDADWQVTNRIEYRHADLDDKWNFLSGFRHRLDDTDTLAGRVLHFDQKFNSGDRAMSTELDVSYSRRPLSDSWFWLNRTRLIFDTLDDSLGKQRGRRMVNNSNVNMVHDERHQISLQYGARYVLDTIDAMRFEGYSDLIGTEYRYDITERWDIGLRGSTLTSWNSGIRQNSYGIMAGFSPIKDIWISLGYNFKGFYDNDFSGAEGRVQGIVLDFRIKFDQDTARQVASQITEVE